MAGNFYNNRQQGIDLLFKSLKDYIKTDNVPLKESCDSVKEYSRFRESEWDNCCLEYGGESHERYHRIYVGPYFERRKSEGKIVTQGVVGIRGHSNWSGRYKKVAETDFSGEHPQNDDADVEIDWKDQVYCEKSRENRYGYCDIIKEYQGKKYRKFSKHKIISFNFFLGSIFFLEHFLIFALI